MRLLLALCLGLASLSQAAEEVVKDWHKPLVGIPITHTRSLAPRFHRRTEGGRNTKSHIYVASQKNTLAALNPTYGKIVWRHSYDDTDPLVTFRPHGPFLTTLSGPGGANLRILEATTGHILWEQQMHPPLLGRISDPVDVGADISYTQGADDVVLLSNSNTVRRVSILDGITKWTWKASDDVSMNLHSRLAQDEKHTYIIGLSKSFASYQLHITTLDALTGAEVASYPIPGNIAGGIDDVVLLDHPTNPSLLWLENGAIKWLSLGARKVATIKSKPMSKLVDLGLANDGFFVALEADGTGTVFRYDATKAGSTPSLVFIFNDSAPGESQSPSIYTGALDKENRPYVSRVFYSFFAKSAGISLYVPHGNNGAGSISGVPLAHDTFSQGIITHVALDVAPLDNDKYLTRAMLTNSVGAMQLWKSYELQWTREESLSDLQALEFVDLPVQTGVEHSGAVSALLKRAVAVSEIAIDLSKTAQTTLSDQLVQFISGKKPVHTEDPSAGENLKPTLPDAPLSLHRDEFGFRKIVVAISATGKIYGIDSANGAIVWSRILGVDMGKIIPTPSLYVIKSVLDGAIVPVVVVIANREDSVGTAVLHLDALTGKVQPKGVVPSFFASNRMWTSFPLLSANRSYALISQDHKAAVYPQSSTLAISSDIYFTRSTGTPVQNQLTGYSVELASKATAAKAVWSLSFGPDETIEYTFKSPGAAEPIASLGKVLADRKTLYKYLNPHVVGVVTRGVSASGASSGTHSVYLVDGVTGAILWHTSVPSDGKLLASMSENWLVFAYEHYHSVGVDSDDRTKGQHIVSVELYEGYARNDKTKSSEISSRSPEMERLTAYQNSFLLPFSITSLAMSTTKYGISSKDVIVSSSKGQVHSISRRLLDPRRHKEKPSAADGEEMLIPYDPLIGDDPRRILSKAYDVVGVKTILSSPALLESTSLVLAYGQDLFFTRVSPSGTFDLLSASFNKIQLVLIILGLSTAIVMVRPIVKRRQLRQQWYS